MPPMPANKPAEVKVGVGLFGIPATLTYVYRARAAQIQSLYCSIVAYNTEI